MCGNNLLIIYAQIYCGNTLKVAITTISIELSCKNKYSYQIIESCCSFTQLSPFFFSHCDGVHAFICSAWISSKSPFSFKWFCISRCLFRSIMPSKLSETTVSSSFAPQPSEWSMILHSIALGYCCLTLFTTISRCMMESKKYRVRRMKSCA